MLLDVDRFGFQARSSPEEEARGDFSASVVAAAVRTSSSMLDEIFVTSLLAGDFGAGSTSDSTDLTVASNALDLVDFSGPGWAFDSRVGVVGESGEFLSFKDAENVRMGDPGVDGALNSAKLESVEVRGGVFGSDLC